MRRSAATAAIVAALVMGASAATGVAGATTTGWHPHGGVGTDQFFGVCFADASHGVVSGTASCLHTSDGGATWLPTTSPTHPDGKLTFIDWRHGWGTVGANVAKTSNGGATWFLYLTSAPTNLLGIDAVDARHVWAVGGMGTLAVSDSSGYYWGLQAWPYEPDYFYGVEFVDTSYGWAVGTSGVIVRSFDGVHWHSASSPTSATLQSVESVDRLHGWVVGTGGVILRTTNGGTSWTAQTIPGIAYLFSVSFADASNGWAIGGTGYAPEHGVILHTLDGGLHWHAQTLPSGIQWLRDVHFVNRCLGWAVGDNGAIVSTATGGWPDTTGPVTTAWSAAASYHGVATLRYRAWDVQSMKATVVLKVRNSNGRWVQAVALGARPTDTVLSYRLHTSLPRGTYRWFVFARDVSGHWQSRLGSASLAIR